ncbi:hypothetical protein G9A89_014444 [Geosiphon pyriformis]|nr:hypothetical protein G9A89_014444 [Geosiphon pyriformis]
MVIVINPPLVDAPQQPPPQSLIQLPSQQQLNLDPMAYTPIAKLEKFTGQKDDAKYGSTMLKRLLWPTDGIMQEHFKPSPISYKILLTHNIKV